MAVSTTNAVSGPYNANGATTVFPFSFTAPSTTEVAVITRDTEGVDTTINPSLYAVSLDGSGGGSITFDTAPASGLKVLIYLDPSFTQEIEFENGSAWLAEPVNEGNDRAALRDQALKRDIDRAIKVPIGESAGILLPTAEERAGRYLAFDGDGDPTPASGTGSDSALRTDLVAAPGSTLVNNLQAGTGAVSRTVQSKLRERVSILDFGGVGDGVTNNTTALTRALLTNKSVYFPEGDYLVSGNFDFGALKTTYGTEIPVVCLFGEGHGRSRILFTGTGTFLKGGTTAPASNGYIQTLDLSDISIVGTGSQGDSLAITYGQFTTTALNGFAGCDSTQIAVEWEFDACSSIRRCEIAQFGTAIKTKLGYGYTIAENHIRWNMVGLDIQAATTTANIIGNTIERNGVGIGLWIASLINIEQNAIQGNYAGADVVSYNWNTLVSFRQNYFEASPKTFVQNGDSGGSFTSNNYSFIENKGLAVEIVDLASHFYFARNRMVSFAVGTTGVGQIVVEDNADDASDGLTRFTNYTGAGAGAIIYRDAALKASQTYNPPSLADGAVDSFNIAVTGAEPGMRATATLTTIQAGFSLNAQVTASGSVHVRLTNSSGGTVDLASGTVTVIAEWI